MSHALAGSFWSRARDYESSIPGGGSKNPFCAGASSFLERRGAARWWVRRWLLAGIQCNPSRSFFSKRMRGRSKDGGWVGREAREKLNRLTGSVCRFVIFKVRRVWLSRSWKTRARGRFLMVHAAVRVTDLDCKDPDGH